MSDRMVGADDGIMVARVVSHKGQSDLLKPNTSLWLRCMKTRQNMAVSFGPLNWLNKTHHEQPWINCLLPPHLWMNDTSITSNIPISTNDRETERKKRWFSNRRPSLSFNASATTRPARRSSRYGCWCRAQTGPQSLQSRLLRPLPLREHQG